MAIESRNKLKEMAKETKESFSWPLKASFRYRKD